MSASTQDPNQKEEHWMKYVLRELSRHGMSVTFVIIAFLLFWVVPQINDLIVVINQAERDWVAVFIFFSTLTVLAFLISTLGYYYTKDRPAGMSPARTLKTGIIKAPMDQKEEFLLKKKYAQVAEEEEYNETQQEYIQRVLPKFLGTLLILIAAYAVNNTYENIYFKPAVPLGNTGLLIWMGLLFAAFNKKLVDRITTWLQQRKWFTYVPIVVLSISFAMILILGLFNKGGSQGDMRRLFYSILLLALVFLIISVSYNALVIKIKERYGAPLIGLLVTAIFVAYIVLFVNPQALKLITPISIVMICLVGIFTLLNILKYIGYKLKLPVLTFFIIGSIGIGIWNANQNNFTHYEASTVDTAIDPADRLDLATYIQQWIKDRKSDMRMHDLQNPFPIILVSAEGGGSRAGLWSFLVQSYLYERNPDYFKKYLFSVSGASGGGVGNNMFYTHAYGLLEGTTTTPFTYQEPQNTFHYRASMVYDKDYLSTSVASLMGRDLVKSITNIGNFRDRGKLLELEWEQQFDTVFEYSQSNPLGQAYLAVRPQLDTHAYIRPLLITNTTHLQTGERAIMSPVKTLEDTYNMAVFRDLLGSYPSTTKMIKRSTAMSMNARFPYISPAARITGRGQYGDAGYYNNIGGAVTHRLEKALRLELAKDTSLIGTYELKHLIIKNFEKVDSTLSYSSQLVAPASIIWNATFAHPVEMEKTFRNTFVVESKRTEIPEYKDGALQWAKIESEPVLPFIPLGRYLSNAAIRSMEKRLQAEEITTTLNTLIPESEVQD